MTVFRSSINSQMVGKPQKRAVVEVERIRLKGLVNLILYLLHIAFSKYY